MFYFNGKVYHIPGVYGIQKVIQKAGGQLLDFNVGLIIGKSMKGTPYNSSSKGSEIMLAYDNANALAEDYGYDDIYTAFVEAKKKGAGAMFVLNAQPNTQASAKLVDSLDAAVLNVLAKPKNYGVFGNDISLALSESASAEVLDSGIATAGGNTSITDSGKTWTVNEHAASWVKIVSGLGAGQTRKIVSNTATALTVAAWTTNPDTTSSYEIVEAKFQITIVPTLGEKLVTANIAALSNNIYVNDLSGLSEGMSVIVAASDWYETAVIQSIDTVYDTVKKGYRLILDVQLTETTLAETPRVFRKDTEKQIVVTFSLSEWNLETIILKMNQSQSEVEFALETGAATLPVAFSETYIQLFDTSTQGLNPSVTTNDFVQIANLFPDWSFEFEKTNLVFIRNILLLSSDASVHSVYKDLSVIMADQKYKKPLITITGVALGVTAWATLVSKAEALNSDTVVLCACGLDDKAAYLSLAPQVFGIKISNPLNHNMTRDLVESAKVEKEWTYLEAESLVKKGVLTVMASKTGYRIIQGINTYQDHAHSWNEQDKKSYFIMQRDLADYYHINLMTALDAIIGADGVTQENVSLAANLTSEKIMKEGLVSDYKINDIKKVENGWDIKTEIKLPDETDFIGVTTYIITGE